LKPCFDQSSKYSQQRNWVQAIILRTDDYPLEEFIDVLDKNEHARYQAFVNPLHKKDFALAHILKRRVLSGYLQLEESTPLHFGKTSMGKPYLHKHPIHFNLSHSRGIVALVFSNSLICGVDVEAHRKQHFSTNLLKVSMTAAEQQAIQGAKNPIAEFYDRWVTKEALIKAQGVGLRQPLDTLCTIKQHYPTMREDLLISQDQLWQLSAPDYSLAICALGPKPDFFVEYPAVLYS